VTQVHFVQTGGFAGLTMVADVDTDHLPAPEATSFEAKVDAALAEPAAAPPGPNVRDDQQYEVTVTRGSTSRVLRAADPNLPPALGALVAELRSKAQPTR
jgi:hypothetical protein